MLSLILLLISFVLWLIIITMKIKLIKTNKKLQKHIIRKQIFPFNIAQYIIIMIQIILNLLIIKNFEVNVFNVIIDILISITEIILMVTNIIKMNNILKQTNPSSKNYQIKKLCSILIIISAILCVFCSLFLTSSTLSLYLHYVI